MIRFIDIRFWLSIIFYLLLPIIRKIKIQIWSLIVKKNGLRLLRQHGFDNREKAKKELFEIRDLIMNYNINKDDYKQLWDEAIDYAENLIKQTDVIYLGLWWIQTRFIYNIINYKLQMLMKKAKI